MQRWPFSGQNPLSLSYVTFAKRPCARDVSFSFWLSRHQHAYRWHDRERHPVVGALASLWALQLVSRFLLLVWPFFSPWRTWHMTFGASSQNHYLSVTRLHLEFLRKLPTSWQKLNQGFLSKASASVHALKCRSLLTRAGRALDRNADCARRPGISGRTCNTPWVPGALGPSPSIRSVVKATFASLSSPSLFQPQTLPRMSSQLSQ